MGCGTSNEQKEEGGSRKKNEAESDNPTAAYPKKDDGAGDAKGGKYKKGEGEGETAGGAEEKESGGAGKPVEAQASKGGGGEGPDGDAPLSQSMLVDLRTKSAKEGGGSVQRWVDSITTPADTDAAETYDPLRRHFISMESLHHKDGGEGGDAM